MIVDGLTSELVELIRNHVSPSTIILDLLYCSLCVLENWAVLFRNDPSQLNDFPILS